MTSKPPKLHQQQVRQELPQELVPGTRVLAKYRRSSKHYKGRILSKNSDKSYEIVFDDGDRDRKVARKSIKGCSRDFSDGDCVITPYGSGIVQGMRWEDMLYTVVLGQWKLSSFSNVVVNIQDDQLELEMADWVRNHILTNYYIFGLQLFLQVACERCEKWRQLPAMVPLSALSENTLGEPWHCGLHQELRERAHPCKVCL